MSYQMFAKVIKKATAKAGIKKRVYPHILRHTRATVLANYLNRATDEHIFRLGSRQRHASSICTS